MDKCNPSGPYGTGMRFPRGTVIMRHIFVFVTSVGRSMLPSSIVRPMTPTPDVVLTSTVVQAEASAPRHMRLRMSGIVPT